MLYPLISQLPDVSISISPKISSQSELETDMMRITAALTLLYIDVRHSIDMNAYITPAFRVHNPDYADITEHSRTG